MAARIGIIGDVHGCLGEFQDLYAKLKSEGITHIFHLGDLVDRGPDSAGVVRFCREHDLRGVMGNHESTLLALIERMEKADFDPAKLSGAKAERLPVARSLSCEDIDYLKRLPKLHALDEFHIVLVHGGLWPRRNLWEQDRSILHLQAINPERPGEVRWLNKPGEYSSDENRAEGFVPWQELYDGPETVVYGHTVYAEPHIRPNSIGIDTGCVFGGRLTALILPDYRFVSVPARAKYADREFNSDD